MPSSANVRNGSKAVLAQLQRPLQSAFVIRMVRTKTGLSFPEFEEGSGLLDLVQRVASALGTSARKPIGSTLEVLVGFEGYPDELALWWDGVTCELSCTGDSVVDIAAIAERLSASRLFVQA